MRSTLPAVAFALALVLGSACAAAAADWLLVSDIHYNPLYHVPSHPGTDTQQGLLDSMFAALRAADRNPPVVIIAGDFLAHGFYGRDAAPTMHELARRFEQTYPRAQFVIALGNNDAACADYEVTPDGPFLHAVARAWAPLVDRNGAAPDFERSFSRDGSYVARLPIANLRAVVVDDVFWSPHYRNRCGDGGGPGAALYAELQAMLRAGPPGSRNWLLLHVPPGIDVHSTLLARGVFVLPFLKAVAETRLETLVEDPGDRVALTIAAHTHKFAYRVIGADGPRPVPVLLAPSVSPIFYNAPSFLKLEVDARGEIRDATEISFDWKRWRGVGDLRSLGLQTFDASALLDLQKKMYGRPALRQTFARLYDGGATVEITESNWKAYWCGATALSIRAYAGCTGGGAAGLGIRVLGLVFALALVGFGLFLRRGAVVPALSKKAGRKTPGV